MVGFGSLPDSYTGGLSGIKRDIPDKCESKCGRKAEWKVEYVKPKETVYYCEQCALRHSSEDEKAGPPEKI